ncbi:MAG: tripartite tricarboxylate transporter substrate binding protein [Ottowia sp.]|uniref:Bug family tripartite tricarboxylate transporter substrate binding protein n=1 Tax=Ottowia sp. TaxID=1898956 RepID=UPI0039E6DBEF
MKTAWIAALCAALLPLGAAAQNYPHRPIRLVVPWAAGTPADVAARVVGERMAAGLGQPIVVDNKPGAAGTIGLSDVLRQPADGYTLYSLSSASLVAPLLYPTQKVDFLKSLTPVGHESWNYNVLVVPTQSAIKSTKELIDTARAKPGSLSFASGGNGTPAHLAGELFNQQLGIKTTHLPYNQFPMAIADLLSDRANFMFLTASAALPQIQGGKLRPLATTGAQRLPALKDVPTMAELGYSAFVLRSFDGFAAKAGTPPEIVKRLNAELNAALSSPEVRERFAPLALEADPMPPEAFGKVIATESEKWLRVARDAKISVD